VSAARLLATPLILLIRVYQRVISPMRPPTCRYYPSCSAYAVTALERYGAVRGSWMAARRLGRCHPWSAGGVDHVPLRDPGTGRPVPGTTGPRGVGSAMPGHPEGTAPAEPHTPDPSRP
jgi:putative membrane protein insertion efficiency factor